MTDEELALKRKKNREACRKSYWKHHEKRKAYITAYHREWRQKLVREAQEDPEAARRLEEMIQARRERDKARGPREGTKRYEDRRRRAAEREAQKAEEARQQEIREAEWKELGWIVAKMNIKAGLTQDAIYELLGGLATKRQITAWCQRGKKSRTLKKPK